MLKIDKNASLTVEKGKGKILVKVNDKYIREEVSGYWITLYGADIDGEKSLFVNDDKIYRMVEGKLSYFKNAKKN